MLLFILSIIEKLLFILFFITCLLIGRCKGQTFLGMGITAHGIEMNGGYLLNKINLEFNYQCPLRRSSIANTSSLLAGYALNDHLTAGAGVAYYRVESFVKYLPEFNYQIIQVTKLKPSFRIEAHAKMNDGLIFIAGNYCDMPWASFGFKTIVSNIKKHR